MSAAENTHTHTHREVWGERFKRAAGGGDGWPECVGDATAETWIIARHVEAVVQVSPRAGGREQRQPSGNVTCSSLLPFILYSLYLSFFIYILFLQWVETCLQPSSCFPYHLILHLFFFFPVFLSSLLFCFFKFIETSTLFSSYCLPFFLPFLSLMLFFLSAFFRYLKEYRDLLRPANFSFFLLSYSFFPVFSSSFNSLVIHSHIYCSFVI